VKSIIYKQPELCKKGVVDVLLLLVVLTIVARTEFEYLCYAIGPALTLLASMPVYSGGPWLWQKAEIDIDSMGDLNELRKWHDVKHLPTPGVPLMVKCSDGAIHEGIRPSYIRSYDDDDLGYVSMNGEKLLNVVQWAIR
jgi:hypothetical protein